MVVILRHGACVPGMVRKCYLAPSTAVGGRGRLSTARLNSARWRPGRESRSVMRSKSVDTEGTTGGRTAPSLVDPEPVVVTRQPLDPGSTPPESKPPSFLNRTRVFRLVVKKLSNLELAIAELALIAALSAVGTIIDQNQSVETYVRNYPDGPEKVLGFLSWQWVLRLQLDHIYTSWYFLALLAVFAASLVACTYSQQWPIVKIARRWRFARTPETVYKRGNGELLPNARIQDLGILLRDEGYKVFLEREKDQSVLYGFKGMAGRYSPIGVHAAMLLVLAGVCWGGLGGSTGSLMAPPGAQVLVADVLRPALPFAPLPDGASTVLTIQDFTIDYRADSSISQYHTDLVATDLDGNVLKQKSISVNDPFRIGGVTMYQTDWSMAALIVHPAPGSASDSFPAEGLSLPMADLDQALGMNARGKLYGTFLPLEAVSDSDGAGAPRGVSLLARDLESVVLYDSTGQFVGVRRPGSGLPIKVEGVELVVDEVIGSSGLELKTDPGVPLVYTGFGAMMLTTMLSYISHSQVWALQQGTQLHVGGRTNRAIIAFQSELSDLLDEVPEYTPDSS